MSKIDTLQQQLIQAQQQADAIRRELEQAISTGKADAIEQIQTLMSEWGVTLQDLGCARKGRPRKAKSQGQDQQPDQTPDPTPDPTAMDAEWPDAVEDAQEAAQEPLKAAA